MPTTSITATTTTTTKETTTTPTQNTCKVTTCYSVPSLYTASLLEFTTAVDADDLNCFDWLFHCPVDATDPVEWSAKPLGWKVVFYWDITVFVCVNIYKYIRMQP